MLFNFLDLGLGSRDQTMLLVGDQHVIDTDGNAGTGRQAKTCLHELIGEHDGFL